MYDLLYVRKRRRRRIAALVSLFSAVGVTSLVIVSFLGRFVGTFTVSLNNSSVRLALSEQQAFTESSSYLRINKLASFEETTFRNIPVDVLDDENVPYDYGKKTSNVSGKETLQFFKYTWYVKNVGYTVATYDLRVNLLETSKSTEGSNRFLDDTLRVMVYENDPLAETETHDYTVYAKQSYEVNFNKNGEKTYQEFISEFDKRTNTEDDEHPLAATFLTNEGKTIAKYSVNNFGKGDLRRYTLVAWLEGFDPDSDNNTGVPVGASLKLGVEITAYEN